MCRHSSCAADKNDKNDSTVARFDKLTFPVTLGFIWFFLVTVYFSFSKLYFYNLFTRFLHVSVNLGDIDIYAVDLLFIMIWWQFYIPIVHALFFFCIGYSHACEKCLRLSCLKQAFPCTGRHSKLDIDSKLKGKKIALKKLWLFWVWGGPKYEAITFPLLFICSRISSWKWFATLIASSWIIVVSFFSLSSHWL